MKTSYAAGFAEVYDRLYSGFAISAAPKIYRFHQEHSQAGVGRFLDLCCGSGQLVRYFADQGYYSTGIDLSAAMLEKARANAGQHLEAGTIELRESDVTNFSIDSPVDLVTSTFDALNHLPDLDALTRTFSCAYKALAPGGLLIFDLHTVTGLRQLNHIQVRDDADILLVSRINYDPQHDRAFAHISGVYCDPSERNWLRFDQHTSVTAWRTSDVLDRLAGVGFSWAVPSALDQLGDIVSEPDSRARLFFVARR